MVNHQSTIDSALKTLAEIQPITLRISGDCMNPLVKNGAAVRVCRCRLYSPGDILVFRCQDGRLLVHRLLGYYLKNGSIRYLTKADAAPRPDAAVQTDHIIGKLVGNVSVGQRIKALGNFVRIVCYRFFIQR